MEIRTIWFIATAAMFALLCVLVSNAVAQEPVEAAFVRGHISDGSGIWRANDFGWFFYDLDKDQGGEELRVDLQGRTAEQEHIVYSSKTWSQQFEYEPWGSFQAVAFLGRPYLAGYLKNSIADDISSLNKGELRAVLIDDDSTQTLNNKKAISLQQGYVLAAAEISEKNGAVNFVLLKNGKPVYASVVSIGENLIYKVNDLPVILVHLVNAMSGGKGEGFAEVDGIFQISDVPNIRLFEGSLLGNMKLTDISEEGIELKNNVSFSLIRDSEIPLTPDLKLIVLDLPDLAYYPVGAFFDYGVHEIRGPVYSASSSIPVRMGDYNSSVIARWNSLNYSGFYFDQKQSLGAETLAFFDIKGRTITPARSPIVYQENNTVVQSGFQYTTMLQAKEFEYKPWGHYFIIGFLGAPWFAGYDSSLQGKTPSLSLLENVDLGRVLMDVELQGKIIAGNYSLEDGYQMRIMDVGNDSLFLQLLKEGILVDSSVVKSNTTYIYKKDLDNINDMPIIMMHFGNVFNNGTHSFAILDGIFQISDRYIFPIDPGTGFGEMEIVLVQPDKMILINPDSINLNKDSNVNIGPGMDIRVADNDTLRYYLHTSTYVVPPPEPPQVNAQDNISSNAAENFSIIVNAAEIRQVMVSILDSGNRTVFTGDITNLGRGSGDLWGFNWQWNATTMMLSDDMSPVLDASGSGVPALLYLNKTTSPRQVGVEFNSEGRIGAITDGVSIYYVSRDEYKRLNSSNDYDAMLANNTIRKAYLKIEPGISMLQFVDVINGKLVPSKVNHTLQGNFEALQPHIVTVGARPGRYELRMRVENAVNAIQTFGQFFNVTPAEVRGVSLGNARALAGGEVSIALQTPKSNNEKWVNISYDAARLKPVNISGECKASWQVDAIEGRIDAHLPAGCAAANLTFAVSSKAQVNETIKLNVTSTSGFEPETVSNGIIIIAAGDKGAKKSSAMGILAGLVALTGAGALARRRR
jgi:S-layer protein (TIGR01567 family)